RPAAWCAEGDGRPGPEDPHQHHRRAGQDAAAAALHRLRSVDACHLRDDREGRHRRRQDQSPRATSPAERALDEIETARRRSSGAQLRLWIICAAILAFYAISWHLAAVDLTKLATGLPKLGRWIASAWPPKVDEIPLLALRIAETVAMAAIGTTLATLLA